MTRRTAQMLLYPGGFAGFGRGVHGIFGMASAGSGLANTPSPTDTSRDAALLYLAALAVKDHTATEFLAELDRHLAARDSSRADRLVAYALMEDVSSQTREIAAQVQNPEPGLDGLALSRTALIAYNNNPQFYRYSEVAPLTAAQVDALAPLFDPLLARVIHADPSLDDARRRAVPLRLPDRRAPEGKGRGGPTRFSRGDQRVVVARQPRKRPRPAGGRRLLRTRPRVAQDGRHRFHRRLGQGRQRRDRRQPIRLLSGDALSGNLQCGKALGGGLRRRARQPHPDLVSGRAACRPERGILRRGQPVSFTRHRGRFPAADAFLRSQYAPVHARRRAVPSPRRRRAFQGRARSARSTGEGPARRPPDFSTTHGRLPPNLQRGRRRGPAPRPGTPSPPRPTTTICV